MIGAKMPIWKTRCARLAAAVATIAALAMYVETQPHQIGSNAALVLAIGATILGYIIKRPTCAFKYTLLGLPSSSEYGARLPVADGGTVHAVCEDSTAPGSVSSPWNRARLEVDVRNKNTGTGVLTYGDAVVVDVVATSLERPVSFDAIVQIKSMPGVEMMRCPMDSESGPTEHAFTWIPPKRGVFLVCVFLFTNSGRPSALCEAVSKKVIVA